MRSLTIGVCIRLLTRPTIKVAPSPIVPCEAMRAASILAAWAEQKAVREIMVFLHNHGVGTARAVRIFKTYGSDAIQVMTDRLARDIRGSSWPGAAST